MASPVLHDDPFTPFDETPDSGRNPTGAQEGTRRCVAIPGHLLPVPADAARLRVGARPLPAGTWVSEVDDDWSPTLAMKEGLVAARGGEVAAHTAGAEAACEEAAEGVLASIGLSSTASGAEALTEAALKVADDLCILVDRGRGFPVLAAAVLCSPNRWRLTDKLGGSMTAIHRPVARYDEDLDNPVNAVMARLSPSRPLWRVNWGVTNHPALFQPDVPPATPSMDPADLWVRVEWQTLRRLPRTGAILFTIRTYQDKMSDFRAREPRVVHDFADLVAKIPEDVATYKSIAPYRDRLVEYLDDR